ncbi:MAG: hypothetical protein QXU18_15390, partial [Thermoplasmatales archaeon]
MPGPNGETYYVRAVIDSNGNIKTSGGFQALGTTNFYGPTMVSGTTLNIYTNPSTTNAIAIYGSDISGDNNQGAQIYMENLTAGSGYSIRVAANGSLQFLPQSYGFTSLQISQNGFVSTKNNNLDDGSGNATIAGSLTVNGEGILGTLDVTGNATIGGSLSSGAISAPSITVNGEGTFETLDVSGNTTLAGNTYFATNQYPIIVTSGGMFGNQNLPYGALGAAWQGVGIVGTTDFASTSSYNVNNRVFITQTNDGTPIFEVQNGSWVQTKNNILDNGSGSATISGSLDVSGNATIGGSLSSGSISAPSIAVSGEGAFGTLDVSGNTTISGSLNVLSPIYGTARFSGDFTSQEIINAGGITFAQINSAVTLPGPLGNSAYFLISTNPSTLSVSSSSDFLYWEGQKLSSINMENLDNVIIFDRGDGEFDLFGGSWTVFNSPNPYFVNSVNFQSNATISGSINVSGAATVGGTLTSSAISAPSINVSGEGAFGTLDISGSATIGSGGIPIILYSGGMTTNASLPYGAFAQAWEGIGIIGTKNFASTSSFTEGNRVFLVQTNDGTSLFEVQNGSWVQTKNNILDNGSGNATFSGSLDVLGNTTIGGSLSSEAINATSINVSSEGTFGTLDVSGNANFLGPTMISGSTLNIYTYPNVGDAIAIFGSDTEGDINQGAQIYMENLTAGSGYSMRVSANGSFQFLPQNYGFASLQISQNGFVNTKNNNLDDGSGNATIAGSLTVNGESTLGTLDVSGNATIGGSLGSGAINAPSVAVSGEGTFGTLDVSGNASFYGPTMVSGTTLNIYTNTATTESIAIYGSDIDGDIDQGAQIYMKNLTAGSGYYIRVASNGAIEFLPEGYGFQSFYISQGGVFWTRNNELDDGSGNATISGSLTVGGEGSLNTLAVSGNATISGTLSANVQFPGSSSTISLANSLEQISVNVNAFSSPQAAVNYILSQGGGEV